MGESPAWSCNLSVYRDADSHDYLMLQDSMFLHMFHLRDLSVRIMVTASHAKPDHNQLSLCLIPVAESYLCNIGAQTGL